MIKAIVCGVLVAMVSGAGLAQESASTAQPPAAPGDTKTHLLPLPRDRSVNDVLALLQAIEPPVDASLVGAHAPHQGKTVLIRLRGQQAEVEKAQQWLAQALANETNRDSAKHAELEARTVSAKFPGGSVEEFVDAVLGKFGFVPPIYQSEELRSLRMRPVEMKLMSISDALSLLSRVPPQDKNGEPVRLIARWSDVSPGILPRPSPEALLELYERQVLVINRESSNAESDGDVRRAAFTLGDETVPKEALDVMLDAVALATNLDGASTTFRAKFHAPTNLLIVRGTFDELGVVAQIVKGKFPNARVELPVTDLSTVTPSPTADGAIGGRR
ncbi:MAG: hypothetical protein SGJ11_02490 [Phycisphaerae bacterium]|nr:hypothetical protein [Phycisphaerae bacterium]